MSEEYSKEQQIKDLEHEIKGMREWITKSTPFDMPHAHSIFELLDEWRFRWDKLKDQLSEDQEAHFQINLNNVLSYTTQMEQLERQLVEAKESIEKALSENNVLDYLCSANCTCDPDVGHICETCFLDSVRGILRKAVKKIDSKNKTISEKTPTEPELAEVREELAEIRINFGIISDHFVTLDGQLDEAMKVLRLIARRKYFNTEAREFVAKFDESKFILNETARAALAKIGEAIKNKIASEKHRRRYDESGKGGD